MIQFLSSGSGFERVQLAAVFPFYFHSPWFLSESRHEMFSQHDTGLARGHDGNARPRPEAEKDDGKYFFFNDGDVVVIMSFEKTIGAGLP